MLCYPTAIVWSLAAVGDIRERRADLCPQQSCSAPGRRRELESESEAFPSSPMLLTRLDQVLSS